ncbi:MAG: hypothetical protein OSB07_05010 [Dehalococcoidia bacterium]|nr:hypothetical protein [Dehalococcoidia bacterium]
MSHDELSGLAAGYALAALDTDDLQLFVAHLASCPECQDDVAGLLLAVDGLSQSADEVEPAPDLRARTMASASAAPQTAMLGSGSKQDSKQPRRAPWWRRPVLWPLPVAAVITVLAIALAVVSVWGSQTDDDLSSAQRRLGLTYDGIEIMAQADQWWRFNGSGVAAGAAGTLAYSPEFGAACLLVWGLPEDDQTVYQARMTRDDGEVSVRKMWRYDNAMWLILDGDPNQLGKLEVTMSTGKSASVLDSLPLIDIPLTSS